ncbi:RagB/SusD family nutrient uptake outer membrane protein [Dyadobacter fermentans]|uniref:RagB/SusD domain protein n=1 Tax=Dyadobacter fermentans (strain ATCC 700827 / DSM 18053 / CIP 107007 / KCTC 52180 / NS114) TaxID=471854 RepID=C6VSS6_DYAFD|nr:RagB/SusD family nutrient uptake outer membrane protein [Dyadobacter fermentans]ACT92898.1 RagB/SusD domain protein [Dyadobacter fermentans DSM 18053]
MRIKTILLFVAISAALGACSDFLDIAPKNAVVPSNFFQSEADFVQAVNGAYAPLQSMYNNSSSWAMGEMRSDNTHFFYNNDFRSPMPEEIDEFVNGAENTVTADRYYINFDMIARANKILSVIDDANLDKAKSDNFKGQVLFLRALAYFDLVRYYGGVPLPLTPATDLGSATLPRSTAEEVYTQIIADATEAAALLPVRANQEAGRATSGAAWMLLGDVHLTRKNWAEAETALLKVTGYTLLGDYAAVFSPSNKNNQESVFEVQYLQGTSLNLSSSFPYAFVPLTPDYTKLTLGPVGSQSASGSGWNIPTDDLLASYESRTADKRFSASIGFLTGPSTVSDTSYVNLPYIKKYQYPHSVFNQTNTNFPVYRYAETLLMLAEAANEQGKLADAQRYLNQVRTRAGLGDSPAKDQTALRAAILKERRVELAFENKRWLDLVRTGNAISVMNAYGAKLKANPAYFYLTPASYTLTEDDLLFPIPFLEIQVNPDLKQNPGY